MYYKMRGYILRIKY